MWIVPTQTTFISSSSAAGLYSANPIRSSNIGCCLNAPPKLTLYHHCGGIGVLSEVTDHWGSALRNGPWFSQDWVGYLHIMTQSCRPSPEAQHHALTTPSPQRSTYKLLRLWSCDNKRKWVKTKGNTGTCEQKITQNHLCLVRHKAFFPNRFHTYWTSTYYVCLSTMEC